MKEIESLMGATTPEIEALMGTITPPGTDNSDIVEGKVDSMKDAAGFPTAPGQPREPHRPLSPSPCKVDAPPCKENETKNSVLPCNHSRAATEGSAMPFNQHRRKRGRASDTEDEDEQWPTKIRITNACTPPGPGFQLAE